jgi:MFS family permease
VIPTTGGRRALVERPGYPWIVLGVALGGLFTALFNNAVLVVLIPDLARELGTTTSTMTWVVTAPLLAMAVLSPVAGKLGDLYGRRRAFLVAEFGAAAFALATAFAPDAVSLVALRTIGATFGAATVPAAAGVVASLFSAERRVQAMGWWGMVMAVGPVIGVAVGGPVAEATTWRVLFVAQTVLILVAFVAAWVVLPESPRVPGVPYDVAGTLLLAATTTSFVVAVNRGPALGFGHPLVVAGFVASPLFGWAFVRWQGRCPHPLLPLAYLRRRNFAAPILAVSLCAFAYQGVLILTPLLLTAELGFSTSRVAVLVAWRPGFYALAGPLAGFCAVRVGERWVMTSGATLVALSTAAYVWIRPGVNEAVIFAVLALTGFGLGLLEPPVASTISSAVDAADFGVAAAAQQMGRQVLTIAGIGVLAALHETGEARVGGLDAYRLPFFVATAVAALAAVAASTTRSLDRRPVTLPAAAPPGDGATSSSRTRLRETGDDGDHLAADHPR